MRHISEILPEVLRDIADRNPQLEGDPEWLATLARLADRRRWSIEARDVARHCEGLPVPDWVEPLPAPDAEATAAARRILRHG